MGISNCVGTSAVHLLYDEASRRRKAHKISTILKEYLGRDLSALHALDVGCSSGWITYSLRDQFAGLVGIDIDREGLLHATRLGGGESTPRFVLGDGGRLPFAREQFDAAICAQVYEHVPHQQALADEVWRVLKPGGVCFFSGPNRLAVMEEHYWLPFLSWLPRPLAHAYVRFTRRGREYDVAARTIWTMRRLWSRFEIRDVTIEMIRHPQRYSVTEQVQRFGALQRLPASVLKAMAWLIPNYNWVLRKPDYRAPSLCLKYPNKTASGGRTSPRFG